jgi:valyl-tRNA synthetase
MSKGRLKEPAGRALAQRVLVGVLDTIVRLIQPVMPFVAESIWQALGEVAPQRGLPGPEAAAKSVCVAPWPTFPAEWRDAGIEARIARMQDLVRRVREVRNLYQVDPRTELAVSVRCGAGVAADFRALEPFIVHLAGVESFACGPDTPKPAQAASVVHSDFEAYVSLAGLIDVGKEVQRKEKQLGEKRKQLQGAQAKLSNPDFLKRAPAEVVQQQRELVSDLENQIRTLESNLRELRQA